MTDIIGQIRGLGVEFTPAQVQGSLALFAPLVPAVDEAQVRRNVVYGPDTRHRLDLFGAQDGGAARPIVVYIHGGGFIAGDKGGPGQPFYNNFGGWAAGLGWLGVTATYRLAPHHPWPSGGDDVAQVVAWLRAQAAGLGGDPTRIVLVGQSAGAAHVAAYVGSAAHRSASVESLAGAAMLSGIYDVASADRNPFQEAYFGTDATRFAEQSSIEGLATTRLPCLYTVAEHDPADFQRQAALLISRRVAAQGIWPEFHWLAGNNHLTPALQIGTSVDNVGPILANFVHRVTGQSTTG